MIIISYKKTNFWNIFKMKFTKNIKFEKIIGNKEQIDYLFSLLNTRKYNISHTSKSTLKSHENFVKNHPYRFWYIIKVNGLCVGTAYVLKNNCINISLINKMSLFPDIVNLLIKMHSPLKEIKSILYILWFYYIK